MRAQYLAQWEWSTLFIQTVLSSAVDCSETPDYIRQEGRDIYNNLVQKTELEIYREISRFFVMNPLSQFPSVDETQNLFW